MNPKASDCNMTKDPIRVIIIDVSSSMDITTIKNLSDSLQNVVCLSTNLKSSTPRIPALGLLVMTSFCECLFPIQMIKGNLQRFYSSINCLTNIVSENIRTENTSGCLHETLINALTQRKKFEKDSEGKWLQLEIVMFTKEPLNSFASEVENVVSKLDVANVKKIQVVGIYSLSNSSKNSNEQICESQSSGENNFSAVVDTLKIGNDKFQFDNFFKNWLHNHDIDRENVHIIIPGFNDPDQELIIKCDMFERIINPELLPIPDQFLLNADSAQKNQKINNFSKNKANSTEIYQLIALKLINQTGICDSILFGMPNILIATSCWKIEWTELETNRQSFISFCQFLNNKQLVLITKLKPSLQNSVSGHFVIFPSPQSSSLLIKSIAVNEILLPSVVLNASSQEMVSKQIQENVDKYLSYLNIEPIYQVPNYTCSLFQCFSKPTVKKTVMFKTPLEKSKSTTRRNLAEKLSF